MATAKTAAKAPAAEENNVTSMVNSITSSYKDVASNFKGYSENLTQYGSVANETVRKTFDGVVAFDRALINFLRANLDNTVEHGRNIAKAPNIANVASLQQAFVTKQIEAVSGQIKELSDIAEEQSKAALAPLFSAVEDAVAKADKK
ncbi:MULTISPECIES: phasin family protein [unclassified Ruegeria]|uniref:phasin family protein n=1 Tax=unclassified Ruegeria TaxID=2625375 RepID=UPI00147FBF86|nr:MULTISPECIES: phasin family protein [unclassified Ruegeria]MBO9412452.1 phasin family protein [Ruegeria sp. R8_1]MBO9416310.1 phasin family protein [Ruegeria sp. R8_2]